jgi:polysaccharide export outer membrane protein
MSSRKLVSSILLVTMILPLVAVEAPAQQQGIEYVIGPGDVLRVAVWRHSDLNQDVTVKSNGTITLPPIGELTAAGLTPSELSREIVQRLRDYTRETTQVTVSVEQFNSRAVYLTGQVTAPGRYSFEAIPDILQLLSSAGGALPSADLSNVSILRPSIGGPELINVDLGAYMRGETAQPLPALMPGDTIEIPSIIGGGGLAGPGMVYIFGEVNTPGAYATSDRIDLFQLIAIAGGTTVDARLDEVSVVMDAGEGHAVAKVDLKSVLTRGTPKPFFLRAGDRVVIGSTQDTFGGQFWNAAGALLTATTQVLTAYLLYLSIEREIDDRRFRNAAIATAQQQQTTTTTP